MTKLKLKAKTKHRRIQNAKAKFSQDMRTSFLFSLFLHIVFFPIFFISWYFTLMKQSAIRFLAFNLLIIVFIISYVAACYITLPSLDKIYYYKPVLSSKFYDRNDELIFEVSM